MKPVSCDRLPLNLPMCLFPLKFNCNILAGKNREFQERELRVVTYGIMSIQSLKKTLIKYVQTFTSGKGIRFCTGR
jgi:hypothetical protein